MQKKINVKNFIPLYRNKGTRKSVNRKTNETILKKKWKRINTSEKKNVVSDFKNLLKTAKEYKEKSTYPKSIAREEYTRKLLNEYLVNEQHQYLDFLQEKGNALLEREKDIIKRGFSNATKNEFKEENKKLKDQILKNQLKQVLEIEQIRKININNTDEKAIFDQELAYFERIERRPEDIEDELKDAFSKMEKDVVKRDENLENLLNLEYDEENMEEIEKHYDEQNKNLTRYEREQRNESVHGVRSSSKFANKLVQMQGEKNTIEQKIEGENEDEFKFMEEGEKVDTNHIKNESVLSFQRTNNFSSEPVRSVSFEKQLKSPVRAIKSSRQNTQLNEPKKELTCGSEFELEIQPTEKPKKELTDSQIFELEIQPTEKPKKELTHVSEFELEIPKKTEQEKEDEMLKKEEEFVKKMELLGFKTWQGEDFKELRKETTKKIKEEKEQTEQEKEEKKKELEQDNVKNEKTYEENQQREEYLTQEEKQNNELQEFDDLILETKLKNENEIKEKLKEINEKLAENENGKGRIQNFLKEEEIQEMLIKNNYDIIVDYAKRDEESSKLTDKNHGEVLRDGFNIDMLHFFIELEINMFKKQNNAKYVNVEVINCIENDGFIEMSENIDTENDIIIFILLIDGHFSTIYFDSQEECLSVFEPLVNKQYREKLILVVREIATILSPKETIKVKLNGNKVQSDDADDKNLCGIYALLFVENQLAGLSFAQSTDFTINEKNEILKETSEADRDGLFDMI